MTKSISIDQPPIRFSLTDALEASFRFGFNCGPAAIAAILNRTPDEVRPHLGLFEAKKHMNSAEVEWSLISLGCKTYSRRLPNRESPSLDLPSPSVVRVQWGGSWLKPGVHKGAAAQRTHWIAHRFHAGSAWIYDVNSGWSTRQDWEAKTVPMILAEVKRNDGTWFYSHAIEIHSGADA